MHRATRRRSPPESVVAGMSPGGRRMASMAISSWRSSSQALAASMASWTLPRLFEDLLHCVRFERLAELVAELLVAGQQRPRRRNGLFDVAAHVLVLGEAGLLGNEADRDAVGGADGPDKVLLDQGHDTQQRALAGPVAADNADLGAGIERQPDVLEDLALFVGFREVFDREDVLLCHDLPEIGVAFQCARVEVGSNPQVSGGATIRQTEINGTTLQLLPVRSTRGSASQPARKPRPRLLMDYLVDLEIFRDALDLLLYLVKRNEVDICDISISQVAEQFKHYLDVIRLIDVERAGDFLVMAATLMEIKSKMLLPRGEEAEADEEDPRLELVRQAVEYKKFKDAAAVLEVHAEQQSFRLPRQPLAVRTGPGPAQQPLRQVELWDLVSAFGRLMRKRLRCSRSKS